MEANIRPALDATFIQARVEIRNAIHRGDIEVAIEKINHIGYQVSCSKASQIVNEICIKVLFRHNDLILVHAPLIYLSRL